MMAAEATDRLTPLLELLEPPQGEESQIAKLLDVVEAMAGALVRIEGKLDALSRNAASSAPSPRK